MEKVAAEATKAGGKVRVLVAEDNKVNQEVVLRMLKLEDIYGKYRFKCDYWLGKLTSRKMSLWPKTDKKRTIWSSSQWNNTTCST